MVKKDKTPHQNKFGTGQETKKEEIKKLKELQLEELGDLPLVGGLFKGLGKLIDLAERVEEAGGEIKKKGEIKGKESVRGIYGFSIKTGIGKMPRIQTFGNIKTVKEKTKPEIKITETREPIVDVFDEKNEILIVAELPGINEKEIETTFKGDILILEAGEEGKRKYYKEILLPARVNPETEEKSYKNGVLEIKFKKI